MNTKPELFHCLTVADAERSRAFFTALGFTETLVVPNSEDPSIIEHAELRWRDNGGFMFGSRREGVSPATEGRSACYLVVDHDEEVDAAHDRAVAAGGSTVEHPTDQPFGGRSATVADPDGNHWSIGSYQGV